MSSMQFSTRISYQFDFCMLVIVNVRYMKNFAKIFITLTEVLLYFLVRSKSNDNRTISLVPLGLDTYVVSFFFN